jgi:hypothetical protein
MPAQEAAPVITMDKVNEIQTGMSYDEVYQMLGQPGLLIAGTKKNNTVYRWSLSGVSFMGRFENNVLTRKNIVGNQTDSPVAFDKDTASFDKELFGAITPGMTYDQVLAAIGMDAQPLTNTNNNVVIYKWTDDHGSSITARFVDKVLVRKTGLIVESGTAPEPASEAADVSADEEEIAQVAARTEAAASYPDTASETAPNSYAEPETPPARSTAAQTRPAPRVRVAGASRRTRDDSEEKDLRGRRSYHPQAKFPDYRRKLRNGSYEIRVFNTTESKADVAVISSEGGLELSIAPGKNASAHVGQGTYQIYFIYDEDPYTLHQGQHIPVAELLTDFSVYLFADSSDVGLLDRGMESSQRSRR